MPSNVPISVCWIWCYMKCLALFNKFDEAFDQIVCKMYSFCFIRKLFWCCNHAFSIFCSTQTQCSLILLNFYVLFSLSFHWRKSMVVIDTIIRCVNGLHWQHPDKQSFGHFRNNNDRCLLLSRHPHEYPNRLLMHSMCDSVKAQPVNSIAPCASHESITVAKE